MGLKNNYANMSSMISRCAVCMFDQVRFKVKIKFQGQTLYDLGPLPSE